MVMKMIYDRLRSQGTRLMYIHTNTQFTVVNGGSNGGVAPVLIMIYTANLRRLNCPLMGAIKSTQLGTLLGETVIIARVVFARSVQHNVYEFGYSFDHQEVTCVSLTISPNRFENCSNNQKSVLTTERQPLAHHQRDYINLNVGQLNLPHGSIVTGDPPRWFNRAALLPAKAGVRV